MGEGKGNVTCPLQNTLSQCLTFKEPFLNVLELFVLKAAAIIDGNCSAEEFFF